MNRLNREIEKRLYTMDLEEFDSAEIVKDWEDLWMFNKIWCAVRKQKNEGVA